MNINKWLEDIHYCLLPPVCVLCGDAGVPGMDLCLPCRNHLPRAGWSCPRCAIPLARNQNGGLCGRCLHRPPAFDFAHAAFTYAHPQDFLLQQLKFNGRLEIARVLGELMAQRLLESAMTRPTLLIPVPLHAQRLRERGFNQAAELARPIGRRLGIPLDNHCCQRRRSTEAQSGLSRRARMKNLRGAFAVRGPVPGHVAIIDDVMTTGSTAQELARTLKESGADRVDVWVCARA